MDEPTSALDSQAEESIFDALPDLFDGKTIIVASHRLSTIKHSDRVLILNQDGLIEAGTHESLQASCDYYGSMVADQKSGAIG